MGALATVRRHVGLLGVQLRLSALLAMQYRWELFADAFFSLFWTATALLPLWLVFEERPRVAGYSFPEALVVLGFFTLLQGVLEGAIHPSLGTVVDHVRTGTLDFVLLKPADAQFLVSTARFAPFRVLNVLAGLAIVVHALGLLGRAPSALDVLASVVLFASAVLILYGLWILTVSAAFYVGRIDNLRYLFTSVFDAARWPASVYRGALGFVFTYVLPLALMTSYPAWALLGLLEPARFVTALVFGLGFALGSRWVFVRALARYTSASS
ncbi:MAG: ABC-2 family transporter protein [Sandaracinaceae bacterium]